MNGALIVIAKEPVPGRVKTRLVPPLTASEAADLARAALSDTLRAASAVDASQRVLALDGRPGPWLPHAWRVVAQPAGTLDVRLVAAFGAASSGPALLIGMDTPQVRPAQLAAFDPDGHDACLGLAEDGGYWAIGLRNPALAAEIISGVPMSTSHTGAEQLRRLHTAGLHVQLLDTLADVDTIDVAYGVAAAAPSTQFAAALRGLDPAVAV